MSVSDNGPRHPVDSAPRPHPHPTETTYPGAPNAGPRRKATGRGRLALIGTVVLAALVVGWVLTHRNAPPPAGGGGRGGAMGGVTSVNSAKAAAADVPVYLTALGTVTPVATVTVRTQLAGQLFSVAFTEGQMVTKGQLLAQVDPRPYQEALAQAQGVVARDEAQLANAKIDLQRYQTLLQQDSIARQTVDTQAALVRQLEATVKSDRAAVSAAQLNVTYTRITAPVSGRVGLRQVDPGNYVSNGDANGLVTITQMAPIDVVFTLSETQIASVVRSMRAGPTPVTAFDRDQSQALAEGTLLTLDNQIDTTTGTVKAKARFTSAGDRLFPNQFVNVRVLVETMHGAIVVPTSAIQRGQNGLFVYTVDRSNTVHMTNVTTGPVTGENTAVLSGLQVGATVITDGSDRLREGSRVLLPGDCTPTGGPGGPGGPGKAGGKPGAKGEKASGNWFTNLFGGKKKTEAAAAAGAQHTRPGVGPDGQRCRQVDLSKGPGNAMDARTNAMLDQLGLSADQKAKIQKIRDQGRDKMMAAMQSGDFATMRKQRTEVSQKMEAVMTPAQRTKYEELRAKMQAEMAAGGGMGGMGGGMGGGGMAGGAPGAAPGSAPGAAPGATTTTSSTSATTTTGGPAPQAQAGGRGGGGAAMTAALGLSPAQQAKIDAIRAEYGPKMREAFQSGDMATGRAVGEEMRTKMDAVMTPEQRAKAAAQREQMRAQGGGFGGGAPQ